MLRTLCIYLLLISTISLQAQGSNLEHLVRGFFKNPESIQWLKHYRGSVDDVNKIAVTIAWDGYNCKGTMTYLHSNKVLKLEGNIVGKTIKLEEINRTKEVSGFLLGTLNDHKIDAEWTNHDGTIGRQVILNEIRPNQVVTYNDFDNQWVKQYKGILDMQEQVDMILHRLNDNELTGTAFFYKNKEKMEVYGTIETSNKIELNFTNKTGQKIAVLHAEPSKNKSISGDFIEADGTKRTASFGLEARMEVANESYADYSTSYEVLYPQSNNRAFNNWIKSTLTEWISTCESQVTFVKKKNINENPSTRAIRRAYVWFDVNHISKDIISGNFTFTNTWDDNIEGATFNFDLKSEEPIELSDIVKKGSDFKNFFKKYAQKEVMNDPNYPQKDYREWVSKQKFDLFTVQKHGLTFSTLFDELYGKTDITIPYADLKPFLKSNNPLN